MAPKRQRSAADVDVLSPLQAFLTRPEKDVGDTAAAPREAWVYTTGGRIERSTVVFSEALLKLFGEVLENATDQVAFGATRVRVEVGDAIVAVRNDGQTFPLEKKVLEEEEEEEEQEKGEDDGNGNGKKRTRTRTRTRTRREMWVPEIVMTHFGSGTNFRDAERAREGAGMNGVGLKCVVALSDRVDVILRDGRLVYRQTIRDNMARVQPPVVEKERKKKEKERNEEWSTSVKFAPSLGRFAGVESLRSLAPVFEANVRRAAAFFGPRLAFEFNGDEPVAERSLAAYMALHGFAPANSVCVEAAAGAFRVGFGLAAQATQDSCVNGIGTYAGGTHVEAARDVLCEHYAEALRKAKAAASKAAIKSRIAVFVFYRARNPRFNRQSKDCLISPVPADEVEALRRAVRKELKRTGDPTGIERELLERARREAQLTVNRALGGRKRAVRVAGLYDADRPGLDASLFICEGESAVSMALNGFDEIGRVKNGAMAARGKIKNVFGEKFEDVMESDGIKNIVQALGLRLGEFDPARLRYGRVVLMMDQDDHGAHLTGEMLALFREYWPALLREGRVFCFVTPLVKCFARGGGDDDDGSNNNKKEVAAFFSERELREWREAGHEQRKYTYKYYKGLGTSEEAEQRAYFRDLQKHLKRFVFDDAGDEALRMAFDKDRAEDRRRWMAEQAVGHIDYTKPEIFVTDFVNGPLRQFALMQARNMLPRLEDGLKVVHRKIVAAALARPRNKEVKVSEFASSLVGAMQYHHGHEAAEQAVRLMAAAYAGSNNLPLLRGHGIFGSRRGGNKSAKFGVGADAAASRYISVSAPRLLDLVFRPEDECILERVEVDGVLAEPRVFHPVVPLVLCNGSTGVGVGHATEIPSFDPLRIVRALLKRTAGDCAWDAALGPPSFRGFEGRVERVGEAWRCFGVFTVLGAQKVRVTEVPINTSFQAYRAFLEKLVDDGAIADVRERSTNERPLFEFTSKTLPLDNPAETERLLKLTAPVKWQFKVWAGSRLMVFATAGEFMERWYARRLQTLRHRKTQVIAKKRADVAERRERVRFAEWVATQRLATLSERCVAEALGVDEKRAHALLGRSLLGCTAKEVRKDREEIAAAARDLSEYEARGVEDIYRAELGELQNALVAMDDLKRKKGQGKGKE